MRFRILLLVCFLSGCLSAGNGYTHEFFISGGYNYCRHHFLDAGLRYYHCGQTFLAFSGASAGCEFSVKTPATIFIPYIGWQGQILTLGYGIRGEYATNKEAQSFGFTPELGWSLFEFLRLTAGYRFVLDKNDPLELHGFRFSVIAAFPLSLMKESE